MAKWVYGEIDFLREFTMCDNIVQLDAVYMDDQGKLQMIIQFAKHGSFLKLITEGQKLSEDSIR